MHTPGRFAFPIVLAALALSAPAAEIFFADPTIHVEGGKYYLTGTRAEKPPGFALLESTNLREWEPPTRGRPTLIVRAGEGTFGTSRFWAPQLLKEGQNYLLTYTADEHVALARSASLTGPYRQEKIGPIDVSDRNIDSFLFRDDDGRYYLYHVRFDRGNYLWVAEFDLKSGRIMPGTLRRCFGKTQGWEATASYKSVPIMEGPTVVKLKGKYYLFYSANHFRSVDYAVGYAVADSPLGPWAKHDRNPILHRSIVGENGSGHGDVFLGPDETLHYVYHVHHSDRKVSPRRTRIVPLVLTWKESSYEIRVAADRIIKPETSDAAAGE